MTDPNPTRAKLMANVRSRQEAEAIIALAEESSARSSPRFWELIGISAQRWYESLSPAPTPLPSDPPSDAMSEEEAAEFARTSKFPFGRYAGISVHNVPPSYLLWLTESNFSRSLRRYLRSSYFQRLHQPDPTDEL